MIELYSFLGCVFFFFSVAVRFGYVHRQFVVNSVSTIHFLNQTKYVMLVGRSFATNSLNGFLGLLLLCFSLHIWMLMVSVACWFIDKTNKNMKNCWISCRTNRRMCASPWPLSLDFVGLCATVHVNCVDEMCLLAKYPCIDTMHIWRTHSTFVHHHEPTPPPITNNEWLNSVLPWFLVDSSKIIIMK